MLFKSGRFASKHQSPFWQQCLLVYTLIRCCCTYLGNSSKHFFKWAIPGLFSLFSSFQYSWQLMFDISFCRWLDSNCRPLELEATALPTEPQPLPKHFLPLQMVLRLTAVALFKATLIRTLEIIWIRKSRWTFYFKYSPKKCLLICSWTCCKTFQITDNSNQQNSTLL